MAPLSVPLVVAHRGASAAAPENTLEAFELAAALGADWVELDVRACAEGELVLCHDATLPDGRAVGSLARAGLPAGVCTLVEALDVCRRVGLGVNVEIKCLPDEPDHDRVGEVTELVVALLDGHVRDAGESPVLVTSFDPRTIDRVRELTDGAVATGWLLFDLRDRARTLERAADAGHVAVNPWDPLVDAELVAAAHAVGLAVNAWTVDDPARLAQLAELGVDGLITNVPDVARQVLARR